MIWDVTSRKPLTLRHGRNLEPDLNAVGWRRFDRDGAADDQRALTDAAQAATFGAAAIEAAPVVEDPEDDAVRVVFELERDLARAAVPRGICQALLCDSVDHELDLRIEPR